ncbi:hypothetical protein CA601_51560 [Paraburkholderia hospita]|nr:hypothetical protein CA601_51560 [Paraburkholderia hospita]OUL74353.1 hypothetical protein CA602_39415 [Paraburkholderia hospita]
MDSLFALIVMPVSGSECHVHFVRPWESGIWQRCPSRAQGYHHADGNSQWLCEAFDKTKASSS